MISIRKILIFSLLLIITFTSNIYAKTETLIDYSSIQFINVSTTNLWKLENGKMKYRQGQVLSLNQAYLKFDTYERAGELNKITVNYSTAWVSVNESYSRLDLKDFNNNLLISHNVNNSNWTPKNNKLEYTYYPTTTGIKTYYVYIGRIYNVELFINSITTLHLPPPFLDNFNVVADTTLNRINLSWSPVDNSVFEIYLNNNKIATTTDSKYIISGLTHNTEYKVDVKAISNDYTYSSTTASQLIKTKNYYVGKVIYQNVDVLMNEAKVFWKPVQDTVYYQLKLGVDGQIISTTNLNYTFNDLEADTNYSVHIRQYSLAGEYSEWNVIDFKTLAYLEIPPDIPKSIFILDKGTDFIKIQVSNTLFAKGYKFYLNNNLITISDNTEFVFTNLNQDMNYQISVIAYNDYGDSYKKTIYERTLKPPVPRISSASTSPKSSITNGIETVDPRQQVIKWEAHDITEGVKVYIDEKYIGTFQDTSEIEVNLDEIEGLEVKPFYDLEIIPLDENGQSYKLKFSALSSGNKGIDMLVKRMTDALNMIKNNGLYLLLSILALLLTIFSVTWLFMKWKLEMATKTSVQLQDATLNVHANTGFKTKLDEAVAKMERVQEGLYNRNNFIQKLIDADDKQLQTKAEKQGLSNANEYSREELQHILLANRDKSSDKKKLETEKLKLEHEKVKSKNKTFKDKVKEALSDGGGSGRSGKGKKKSGDLDKRIKELEQKIARL